tara:strand:+ start:10028 stop:10726 length:699 start_codon:yes stop_codon:yes gene_type:complete
MQNIAIFGFKDSTTGQLINMLDDKLKRKLNCILNINELPKINISEEHKRNPNKKTEYISNNKIFGLPIFHKKNFLKILKERKIQSVFIIEDAGQQRSNIFKQLKKEKIKILSFIHNSVRLMGNNKIGKGVIIFPDCYIGYKSDIGDGVLMQSGCRIDHHNVIGNFCDLNPNLTTGGFTKIGNYCEINISVDIINRISIGNFSRVGAGSLVLKNIKSKELHYGRPAKFIRKNN